MKKENLKKTIVAFGAVALISGGLTLSSVHASGTEAAVEEAAGQATEKAAESAVQQAATEVTENAKQQAIGLAKDQANQAVDTAASKANEALTANPPAAGAAEAAKGASN